MFPGLILIIDLLGNIVHIYKNYQKKNIKKLSRLRTNGNQRCYNKTMPNKKIKPFALLSGTFMKATLLVAFFLLFTACNSELDQRKEFFEGQVTDSIPISSKADNQKIKSVEVMLDSGKKINVFLEESFSIKAGDSVTVFKYEDSPVHYLKRE